MTLNTSEFIVGKKKVDFLFDYRDQVISHFDMCLLEPKSCPLHCGVIMGKSSSIEDHFAEYSKTHLNTTVEWMIHSKKNKV